MKNINLDEILNKYSITNTEAKKKIQETVEAFHKEIESENCVDILWDSTVNNYYKNTYKLKNALNNKHIRENINSNVIHNLDKFMDICQNPELHIAFVGAIKAGKSTLINALLGQNLASIAVTPETAALTKFKATDNENYVRLTFYTHDEWNIVWNSVRDSKAEVFIQEYEELNAESEKNNWLGKEPIIKEFRDIEELKEEIKKWTSSKRATHYFVKEVEVGIVNSNIPKGIIFVDTPGLDDPVKYRSDITRTYIDRANAVLVCVKSDALTGGELATIYSVFANSRYNPEKIYVVGTQLDTLNRPNENWKEQKQEWIKHLSKNDCFGSKRLAERNLIGVAAYLYNLIMGYNKLSQEDIDYELEPVARKFRIKEIERNLDKLQECSNINLLKGKLNEEILTKNKKLLIEDISDSYKNNKVDLINLLKVIKENQEDILRIADADIDSIRKECQSSKLILAQAQAEKIDMEKALKQIRGLTEKRAEELYKQIRQLGGGVNLG